MESDKIDAVTSLERELSTARVTRIDGKHVDSVHFRFEDAPIPLAVAWFCIGALTNDGWTPSHMDWFVPDGIRVTQLSFIRPAQ